VWIADRWNGKDAGEEGSMRATNALKAIGRRKVASIAAMAVWLLAGAPLRAQTVTGTLPTGMNPATVVVNPVTNQIYVANANSNNVTVIDGFSNNIATVATGTQPSAEAVNSLTNQIYVANFASNNVTVIDGATNITATISMASGPSP
jgi:YVTN family beta-propeller protein